MSRSEVGMAELRSRVPDELVEELLKRLPYVSEGIRNPRVLPDAKWVAFDLRPGFEDQAQVVARRIADVAEKLCSNRWAGILRTLARRDQLPSSFHDDPHPLLVEQRELVEFGRGRYGFGPKVVRLIEFLTSASGGWPRSSRPIGIPSQP